MIWSFAACGGGGDDDGAGPDAAVAAACNPLGGGACMLPWPSMIYADDDPSTPTGYRIHLPAEAMPVNIDGIAVDPGPWNRYDGFSPNAPMIVAFPTGVSSAGLPGHQDLSASLADDAPVVLMNMATGDKVPMFAEVDANESIYPDDHFMRSLIIRPMIRLQPATRYVVAIRKAVKAYDGSDIPIAPAFQALLDGTSFDHPLFAKLQARYPDIFSFLEQHGIPKTDLVLAWDFVTASDEFLTSDLLAMRTQALPMMDNGAADLTYDAEVDTTVTDPRVHALITGTFDAPMFLSDGEKDDSVMNRDATGLPVVNGVFRFNFAAVIPACATTQAPLPVILFGHGLFGSGEDYARDDLFWQIANQDCAIIIATDFIGLTSRNVATAAYAVNDLNKFPGIIDKLAQSIINNMALERIAKGKFVTDPMFMDGATQLVDPSRLYYYGASLGGIMGNLYMAYEPDVLRGALGVPGGNWSLMFERSFAWPALQLALQGAYKDFRLDQELVGLVGMLWDRYDPITTATRVVNDPLPDTPPKQILMYAAVADSLVTNLSTYMMARTMGIQITLPSVVEPFGLTGSDQPLMSGLTIADEHETPVPPEENIPPKGDSGTHVGVNKRQRIQDEVIEFLLNGVVRNFCEVGGTPAACDCATGACGDRI